MHPTELDQIPTKDPFVLWRPTLLVRAMTEAELAGRDAVKMRMEGDMRFGNLTTTQRGIIRQVLDAGGSVALDTVDGRIVAGLLRKGLVEKGGDSLTVTDKARKLATGRKPGPKPSKPKSQPEPGNGTTPTPEPAAALPTDAANSLFDAIAKGVAQAVVQVLRG